MFEFVKKLFCKHKYNLKIVLPCIFKTIEGQHLDCPVYLYECNKCGKRKVIKDMNSFYKPSLLKQLKMWSKHEIEISHKNVFFKYNPHMKGLCNEE